ncbi:hypothetical protein F5050DRAFT_1811327 [Lentinula boryana]|uniref:Uncharacterized protein n=1 Tax=Lentinula boryana TaxID=40481 RepID=A0ABQ8Q1E8_9AGAR|nr:hypothetical protein F5050DRAFT_1811327 [Lentinula boryana]
MKIIFIFNTLVLSVPILSSNFAAARPCCTSSLVHNSELEDRGMAYTSPPPPPRPSVPHGAICFFVLSHESTKGPKLSSSRVKLKSSQIQMDEKFTCGWGPKAVEKEPMDRLCVLTADDSFKKLAMVYSQEIIQDPNSSRTVHFYENKMTIQPQLLNNKELNFGGFCYTLMEIENMVGKGLDWTIPWQDWNIAKWPTDYDEKLVPVQKIARHHEDQASMAAAFDYRRA